MSDDICQHLEGHRKGKISKNHNLADKAVLYILHHMSRTGFYKMQPVSSQPYNTICCDYIICWSCAPDKKLVEVQDCGIVLICTIIFRTCIRKQQITLLCEMLWGKKHRAWAKKHTLQCWASKALLTWSGHATYQ